MLKYEGTDKIRDIKYEGGYVDKIYYDNNTLLVFTSDKEKTGVDEVLFKGRKLIDVTSYGKCIQTNLPLGYTQLEYIESTGTQYIDTGVNIGENIQTKVKFGKTTNSFTKFGFIIGGGGHYQGLVTRTSQNSYYMSMYNSSQNTVVITMPDDVFEVTFNTPEHKVIINNTDSFDLVLISPYEINTTIGVFNTPNTSGNIGIGKVYSFVIKDNSSNSIVSNLIPAKNASNIVGMYDTVSGQFFTNAGTGDFIAGPDAVPTPDKPVDIVCNNGVLKFDSVNQEIYTDGTVETINVHGKNLFDPTKVLFGYYRNRTTGNKVQSSSNFMSSDDGYIPCLPNTTYTFVGTNKTNGTYSKHNAIYFFDSAKNYLGASPYEISQPTTGTTPSNCHYLQVRSNPLDNSTPIQDAFAQFNWQLELSSTATAYVPYYDGGTATTEMLLKVDDYQDEQEILSGAVTRKVGVKVLDGTERWVLYAGNYFTNAIDATAAQQKLVVSSHFISSTSSGMRITSGNASLKLFSSAIPFCTSVSELTDWLADQYAAGTPVIVVYPLAEPTTEQVLGQQLTIQQGNNTVEVTQASVDDILLKVKYK